MFRLHSLHRRVNRLVCVVARHVARQQIDRRQKCGRPHSTGTIRSFDDPGHSWPNRPTWALVCWLHIYRYSYLMDVSLACWRPAEMGCWSID